LSQKLYQSEMITQAQQTNLDKLKKDIKAKDTEVRFWKKAEMDLQLKIKELQESEEQLKSQ
jgi:hypothetical protein